MNLTDWNILLSCEHAGNRLPKNWSFLRKSISKSLLESHYAWDIGALKLAQKLQKTLDIKLFFYPYTRLVVDLNRSAHRCLGIATKDLDENSKRKLIGELYEPYRQQIFKYLEQSIASKKKCYI